MQWPKVHAHHSFFAYSYEKSSAPSEYHYPIQIHFGINTSLKTKHILTLLS